MRLDRVRAATLGETLANQLGVTRRSLGRRVAADHSRPRRCTRADARGRHRRDGCRDARGRSRRDRRAARGGPDRDLPWADDAALRQRCRRRRRQHRDHAHSGCGARDGLEGAFEVRGDTAAAARGAQAISMAAARSSRYFDAGHRDSGDYEIPGFAHADVDASTAGPDDAFGVLPNSAAESQSAAFGASWLGDKGILWREPQRVRHAVWNTVAYSRPRRRGGRAHRLEAAPLRRARRLGWLGKAIDGIDLRLGLSDYEHVELEADAIGTRSTNDAAELRLEPTHRAVGRWTARSACSSATASSQPSATKLRAARRYVDRGRVPRRAARFVRVELSFGGRGVADR